MAFNKVVPVTVGTPMVTVSAQMVRGQKLKSSLNLAETFISAYPEMLFAVIYEGTEDDAGKLRVEACKEGDEGAVKVTRLKWGGGRIQLPKMDCTAKKDHGKIGCTIVLEDKPNAFVIGLPDFDPINNPVAQARPIAPVAPAPAPVARAPMAQLPIERGTTVVKAKAKVGGLVNLDGMPVDPDFVHVKPIEYLSKKGIKLSKLAGDFWQSLDTSDKDNEALRITTDMLLKTINALRKKSELAPIVREQLINEGA